MSHIHTTKHLPSSSKMHHSSLLRTSCTTLSVTTHPHSCASPTTAHRLPPIVPFTSPLAPTLANQLDTIVIFIDIPTLGDPPQPWIASKDCTLAQLASQVAAEYGVRVCDIRLFYNGYRYGWSEEVKVGRVKGGGLGMKERNVVYVLIGGR